MWRVPHKLPPFIFTTSVNSRTFFCWRRKLINRLFRTSKLFIIYLRCRAESTGSMSFPDCSFPFRLQQQLGRILPTANVIRPSMRCRLQVPFFFQTLSRVRVHKRQRSALADHFGVRLNPSVYDDSSRHVSSGVYLFEKISSWFVSHFWPRSSGVDYGMLFRISSLVESIEPIAKGRKIAQHRKIQW